jgi:hypothetical protein
MRPSEPSRFSEMLLRIKRWFRPEPKSPEDPYAYVTAPKKPRPPHLRASAVAEPPEE